MFKKYHWVKLSEYIMVGNSGIYMGFAIFQGIDWA